MAQLILLNGPPGIGKSTLALRFVAGHPLALCLDVDGVRSQLGRWQQHPERAGSLARAVALAMATEHLRAGYDVVVPQYLGRIDFIEQLAETAHLTCSTFHEIVLMDSRDGAITRFHARVGDATMHEHHRSAAEMASGYGGLAAMWERLTILLAQRPRAQVITTVAGDVDGAYEAVLSALRRQP